MVRGICASIAVMSLLAESAAAQRPGSGTLPNPDAPAVASTSQATLGDPQLQAAAGTGPADSAPLTAPSATVLFTGTYTTLPRPNSDPVTGTRLGETPVPACAEGSSVPRTFRPWFENMSLFVGLDGFKEPADLGVNANFGYRLAFNWGLPVFEQAGVGVQVGTAVNHSENAVRILKSVEDTVERWQNFTTVGVFQRATGGLHWGVVYDFRFDDYYDNTRAGQWRAQIGTEVGPDSELGFWATFRDHGSNAAIGPYNFSVEPISQWNVYWRRIWPNEIVTRLWVGLASEHSRFNILMPGQPQINHPFTFGGDFYVPLTDNLALFGEAHFITPNDTGVVAATMGFALYPGSARGTARNRFAPLMPVANNTTFPLNVR